MSICLPRCSRAWLPLAVLAVSAFLCLAVAEVSAQESAFIDNSNSAFDDDGPTGGAKPPEPKPMVKYARIEEIERGKPLLVIKYPYKSLRDASLEVRLLTTREVDPRDVRPWRFKSDLMKAELTVNVHGARTRAFEDGFFREFSKGDFAANIYGERSTVGKPSVYVAKKLAKDSPAPGAIVCYPFAEDWGGNGQELFLPLPRAYFHESGDLFVYMMCHGELIWEQEMKWPGLGK